jgi:hypothetical protein
VGEALIQCVLDNFDDAPAFISAEPFFDSEGLSSEDLLAWYLRLGFSKWKDETNIGGKWLIREPWIQNEPTED